MASYMTHQTAIEYCHNYCDNATRLRIEEAISGLQKQFSTPAVSPSETDASSCPPYSCTIDLSAPFFLKRESIDPDTPPHRGPWAPIQAELRGTVLLIHDSATSRRHPLHLLNRVLSKSPPPYPSTRAYTLQSGKAGIAPDYLDRAFVIRIRAEQDQFLLATDSREVLLEWVAGLNQGIDISAPLDVRPMPGYESLRKLSQSEGREEDCAPSGDGGGARDSRRGSGTRYDYDFTCALAERRR